MADVSIVASDVANVPQDYKVPGAQEILLKAVGATVNGSSASGSFLPALQLIDPAGHVMWTAVNRSLPVAAGASALVSWFPGGGVDHALTTSGGITTLTSSGGSLVVTTPAGPTTNLDLAASGVVAGTYGDASDVAQVTVNAQGVVTGAASVSIVGGGVVVGSDGWINDTAETWTFASFAAGPPAVGTFTVTGDVRSKYTMGTRIKLTQTTTKYFLVTADPTFGAGSTTVTISGGTDYTLANAAISNNFHSYVVNPQGFPTWLNFNAGVTGLTSNVGNASVFTMEGFNCYVDMFLNGTSNSTSFAVVLPVTPDTNNYPSALIGPCINAGVNQTIMALISMTAATTAQSILLTYNSAPTAWTNSGSKRFTTSGFYKVV